MIKESQNFYVPTIDSPTKFEVSSSYNENSSPISYTEFTQPNFSQSSPRMIPYSYANNSNLTVSSNSHTSFSNSSSSYSQDNSILIDTSNTTNSPRPSKQRKLKISRKQMLCDDAVDIMNAWFDDHVNSPYPSPEEKERIALAGNITVKQVTAWFSNRRNRTQNTKSKRMKRMFDEQLNSVFAQIVDDKPDTQLIINAFKCSLESRKATC